MATVVLKNVKKIYNGGVLAVHDFNLSIKDKEFIVFVGPSGCGKSTTLRMVAGLEEISEGECYIDDVLVNDRPPKERGISMVFQNYALYPHLTVYENMAFPLRLLRGKDKLSNDQIYERVTDAARTLGITQYLARKPKNLSGGQRQRVAIGRAMVRDSKVFLMDEPLSNLDAKLRNQMRAEIILLRKKINSTFIYVTHDQTEAMTLGDRIVIMKDGYIMQVGSPTEVFDRPANLFVAEFIGAPKMNTFDAKLVKDGKKYHVEAFGCKLPVEGPKAAELEAAGIGSMDITLGVRPEHMAWSEKETEGYIPAEIAVNEMMGSEVHLHVRTLNEQGPKATLIVRIPTVGLSDEQRASLVAGGKIFVGADAKVMHFFHPLSQLDKMLNAIHDTRDKGLAPQGVANRLDIELEKANALIEEANQKGFTTLNKAHHIVLTHEGKVEAERIKDTNLLYGPGEEAAASQAN